VLTDARQTVNMMKMLARILGGAIIAVGLLATSGIAYTADATAKRYPWDRRPGKCFLPDAIPNSPMCAESPNWTDWAGTSTSVQRLFAEPDFDLIARAESELAESTERFPSGEYYFDAWYWALDVMFGQQPDRYGEALQKWKAAAKGKGQVLLAEAMSRRGEAWEARGPGVANTVSPEAWKIYESKMREADAVLDSAPAALKKTGTWHVMKLSVVMQMGGKLGSGEDVFKAAVAAWPEYGRVYKTAINFSMPQWGGSFAEVEEVAQYAYDKTKATEGATWYATLYTDTFVGSSRFTLRDSDVDWELMKKGFGDAMGKPGTDGRLFSFAAMACQMRDRSEAKRLYDLIDKLPEAKRPRMTTDPCRKFANGIDA
jgi:hypothetical protein